jgi:DNA-binding NtrC family response regulator
MRVVVIEDHEDSAEWLRAFLEHRHHRVHVLYDGTRAVQVVEEEGPDLVLVDLMLPDTDAFELMAPMREKSPGSAIVVMTGHASVPRAVEAMQAGALSFLEKPLDPERLAHVLEQAERRITRSREAGTPQAATNEVLQLGGLVTQSESMLRVLDLAMAVAATDASVVISGENGTGKELIADALHGNSQRKNGPFVKINCAAIPAELIESELFGYKRGAFTGAVSDRTGLFELARGGTLLLDEIGDMPPHLQAKLLRVLQDRRARPLGSQRDVELDFRLICATNCDLQEQIKAGKFREDLYFRINTITLKVPPLRDRPEDVSLLANHFRAKFAEEYQRPVTGISPETMRLLVNHIWRGNVRELEHAIERAVIVAQGSLLEPDDLPETIRVQQPETNAQIAAPRLQTLAALEKWAIQRTLEHTRGNKRAAAAILGVYRPTLYNKLRKYGIGDIAEVPRRDP